MSVSGLTYRQLEAVVTVAERGNISHAAVRLSMSQPALSRMIATVERHFGMTFFDRDGRGVTPTHAGVRLVAHARKALHQLDEMEDELKSLDGQLRGKICVVMPDTTGHSLALPLIDRVAANHPLIELRIMDAHPNNIHLAVAAGDAAVGIVSSAHRSGRLHRAPLAAEQLRLVGPRHWTPPDEIALAELADLPLTLPAIVPGLRHLVDGAFARQGLRPTVILELDSQDALIEVVRSGRAWSIMSYAGVKRLVERGELRACPIVSPSIDRTLSVGLPDGRPATNLMRTMVTEIRSVVADLADSVGWVPLD
jgi:LysR family nitrogen assimilation transcriptional regulator